MLAVGGLAVAVGLLLWVMSGISGSGSTAATTTPPTTAPSGSSTTPPSTSHHHTPTISWKSVPVTVFNGYSYSVPAATTSSQLLRAHGWNVATIGDTNPKNPSLVNSYVVYPVGKLAAARAVARELKLAKPVPLASATGVPSSLTTVAIVIGSGGLPSLSG